MVGQSYRFQTTSKTFSSGLSKDLCMIFSLTVDSPVSQNTSELFEPSISMSFGGTRFVSIFGPLAIFSKYILTDTNGKVFLIIHHDSAMRMFDCLMKTPV